MKAPQGEATITTQDPDPTPAARRLRAPGWAGALGWPAGRGRDGLIARFLSQVGEATRREEVHELLVRAARELTGAPRVELRPVGGPRRVIVSRSAPGAPSREDLRLPIRYRGEDLGSLLLWTGHRRRPSPSGVLALESLCGIAAIADRMLGREPMLRLARMPRAEVDPRPRALLLPFLRQLILLARRRREPLSVLAIGLDRPVGMPPGGDPLRLEVEGAAHPVLGAVLGAIRASDLVVQDDPRTLIAVLPNASDVNAPLIAEAILRAAAEADAEPESERPGDGLAIGVACFPDDAAEADVLLDVAIEGLRRARLSDPPRVVLADRPAATPRVVVGDGSSLAG